jgi:glycosidase
LNTYRTLIGMRNHSSALSDGAFTLMSHDDDAALVFTRSDARQQVWVAINYASAATTVNVPPGTWHALAAPAGMEGFKPGPLAIPAHQWLVLQQQLND